MGQREILKNLIVYFTFKVGNLTPTRLVKLIYLADLDHYKKYRCTISEVPFLNYHHGPWHHIIDKTVQEECGELIEVESIKTRKGDVIRIHKPKVKQTSVRFPRPEMFETLKKVVQDWGNVPLEKIVKHIKSTTPFIQSQKRDVIDFMLVDSEFRESIERASKQAKEGKLKEKSLNEL